MEWYKKLIPSRIRTSGSHRRVPEGVWEKCDSCHALLYQTEFKKNLYVCPKCEHAKRLGARQRLDLFLDEKGRQEIATGIESVDFLKFKDRKKYRDRLNEMKKVTKEEEALIAMSGALNEKTVVAVAFEFSFIGGSMGAVVGERFRRATETAIEKKCALICFSASGGARMQESLVSLFQMSKTAAVLTRLSEQRLPFVSVLLDPTMGGVSASLAMLGDVIMAEPKALIGFAGPRIIKQTVGEELPQNFQMSEFLLEHGGIDMVVKRDQLRDRISNVIDLLDAGKS